jgi:uncharacterized small protein (DUF1192 family)
MDGSTFDRWTRRRFGHLAGGAAAALLGSATAADAKKTCKKIRCRTLLETCQPDSTKQSCCQGLNCDPVEGQGVGLRCCLGRRQRCQESSQCCGTTICLGITGLAGTRCCGAGGQFCYETADCCSGYVCDGIACAAIGDRALKANFGSVDPADMLERVRDLPISTWNYASDDPAIRHIGPMAQDFAALFGVGADDRHIHPIDGQGVALAAVQGLAEEIAALRAENARLAARLEALDRELRQGASHFRAAERV